MELLSKIIVVDLEATCWLGKPPAGQRSEIIQVGAVLCDLVNFKIIKELDLKLKPRTSSLSPFCTQLTGLTQEVIDREGISFRDAVYRIHDAFGGNTTEWMSWGGYDKRMIQETLDWYDDLTIEPPFSRRHYNLKEHYSIMMRSSNGNGLKDAAATLLLPWQGREHDALDDARMAAKILMSLQQGIQSWANQLGWLKHQQS